MLAKIPHKEREQLSNMPAHQTGRFSHSEMQKITGKSSAIICQFQNSQILSPLSNSIAMHLIKASFISLHFFVIPMRTMLRLFSIGISKSMIQIGDGQFQTKRQPPYTEFLQNVSLQLYIITVFFKAFLFFSITNISYSLILIHE